TEANLVGDSFATATATVQAQIAPATGPAITGPTAPVAGLTYTAFVGTTAGRTYFWSVTDAGGDTSRGAIVSRGGAAGRLSPNGTVNAIDFIAGPYPTVTGPAPIDITIAVTETDQAGNMVSSTLAAKLGPPAAPSIDAPDFATTGKVYTASVVAKTNAVYTWSIDNALAD